MEPDPPSSSNGGPDADGLTLRGVRIVRVSDDEVVLKRGLSEVRLAFPGLAGIVDRVSELADGTIDEEKLVAAFEPDLQPQVRRLVSGIRSRGLLHPADSGNPTESFWFSMTPFSADGGTGLEGASAVVIGTGAVADSVADALRACGVGAVSLSGDAEHAPAADVWCAASEAPVEAGVGLIGAAEVALRSGSSSCRCGWRTWSSGLAR